MTQCPRMAVRAVAERY